MAGPLSHIRVLDLSRVLAAPWTGQNLADLGAEVIKVERPEKGDDSRAFGPPWLKDASGKETTESAYFACANRGKKSITVDLSKPEGQGIVRELAARCDVLLENYKFGDLARYGLGYDDLKQLNPRLVYCSVTGFGQTGPYRERPGYDFMIQGMGGLMSVTGERDDLPGGGPQRVGHPDRRHHDRHVRDDRGVRGARAPRRDRRGPAPRPRAVRYRRSRSRQPGA